MLNERCISIIKYFSENKENITLKILSDHFGISERSIRYDIDNINYFVTTQPCKKLGTSSFYTRLRREKRGGICGA